MSESFRAARAAFFLQLALLAVTAVALCLIALEVAGERIGPINAVLVLLLLTILVAARFGFWAGLIAAIASDVILFYFFFEPVLEFWTTDSEHVAALLLFLLVAASFNVILEAVRGLRATALGESSAPAVPAEQQPAAAGPLQIDSAEHLVFLEGKELDLTATEFKLLEFFANNPGRILKHTTILANVWGAGYTEDTQVLRTYVKQLRAKLGDDPAAPRFIRTETGVGYRFIQPRPELPARLAPRLGGQSALNVASGDGGSGPAPLS